MMAIREKLEALNAFDIKTMWTVLRLQMTLDPGELPCARLSRTSGPGEPRS